MSKSRPDINLRRSRLLDLRLGLLIALAAAGLALSLVLTFHFYDLRQAGGGFKSSCNLSEHLNCDAVAASPYAELFHGIPLCTLAAGWYLAMILIALGGLSRKWRCESLRVLAAMTVVGALASLGYLTVMFAVIQIYCIYCLGLDLVAFSTLGLAISLKLENPRQTPMNFSQILRLGALLLTAVLVTVTALKGLKEVRYDDREVEAAVDEILQSPTVPIKTDQSFASLGPPAAAVNIVEFSDFQCPYCRMGALTLNSIVNLFPTQVRVIFRHFPLDAACNPKVSHTVHPMACEASRAAYCAGMQGKFEPMYQRLFESQAELAPGKPHEWAVQIGVDENAFNLCVDAPGTYDVLHQDIAEGAALGVSATPAFFINGHMIKGAMPVPVFKKLIDRLLVKP